MWKRLMVMLLIPAAVVAQSGKDAAGLTLEESFRLMTKENRALKIARKQVEIAREERRIIRAAWFPSLDASGAYVHLSGRVEVKEPLKGFVDSAKEWIDETVPAGKMLSSLLDGLGAAALTVPLLGQNLTTVDASLLWPVFTGGKRIYADRMGRSVQQLAETGVAQTEAFLLVALVEAYYGVRLAGSVVEVREKMLSDMQEHYRNALKMQKNGMLTKAERLVVEVGRDEARRELESARKTCKVAQQVLCTLLNREQEQEILPLTPLFLNEELPPESSFKEMIPAGNYAVEGLRCQAELLKNKERINRSDWLPDIALFGKQTLYASHLPKNLLPRTVVGVGFTWNLFNGGKREAALRQTRRSMESLSEERKKTIDDLGVAADKLYSEMQNAQDNVKALRTTMALSRELVRIRRKSFQEGMATSTEMVDAETTLSEVRIAFLSACFQYDVALATLLATCGIPEQFWQYARQGKTDVEWEQE